MSMPNEDKTINAEVLRGSLKVNFMIIFLLFMN